jgi:hypothetical protein
VDSSALLLLLRQTQTQKVCPDDLSEKYFNVDFTLGYNSYITQINNAKTTLEKRTKR